MARTISIAMIVKDESAHLPECLSSVREIADEICIVDTGSHDDTLLIAREFGAVVSVFIWCDDFSAARNESLRLCKSDWVFVIDADERVASEDLSRIRALAEGPLDRAYRFTTQNYTDTTAVTDFHACSPDAPYAEGYAGWYPSTKVRLFPNHHGARFEGKIHELVNQSLEHAGIHIVNSDVPIHHYPYARTHEEIQAKHALYLRLGHEKVKARPDDAHSHAELGNQYSEVGDFANAAVAYRESLRLNPSNPIVLRDLGATLHLLERRDEAAKALQLAVELDPSSVDAWRNLGVVHVDAKEWDAAIECFHKAMALNPSWTEGCRYVSVALEGAGRFAEAAAASLKAIEANPDSLECLKLFIHQMLRLGQRGQAREVLLKLIERVRRPADYHNALGELYYYDELYDEAARHFKAAAAEGDAAAYNNLGVVCFKQGRYEDAKKAYEQCLALAPAHKAARDNLHKVLARCQKPQ